MNMLKRLTGSCAVLGLALLLLSGCAPKEGAGTTKKEAKKEEDPPPHGGTLFAVPDHKYHAELVVDRGKKEATVYLYDDKVRNLVSTKADAITITIKNGTPIPIALKPQPQKDDPKDAASCFVGTHDRLEKALDLDKVEISGIVEGKSYVFTLDME